MSKAKQPKQIKNLTLFTILGFNFKHSLKALGIITNPTYKVEINSRVLV